MDFEVIGLLLIFIVILLLCYLTTKFIGKKFSGRAGNRNMKVIETLSLGLDRCLYLIRAGKKYFLFYSSKKGLELVSEIEMEEQPEEVSQDESKSANISDFKRIFETYSGLGNRTPKDSGTVDSSENGEEKPAGILGSIGRLKKINDKSN